MAHVLTPCILMCVLALVHTQIMVSCGMSKKSRQLASSARYVDWNPSSVYSRTVSVSLDCTSMVCFHSKHVMGVVVLLGLSVCRSVGRSVCLSV